MNLLLNKICYEFLLLQNYDAYFKFSILDRGKDLFHQFIVDLYMKIEAERLRYISLNRRSLRVENYVYFRDAIINNGNASDHGQLIILPSVFTGGRRYVNKYTK